MSTTMSNNNGSIGMQTLITPSNEKMTSDTTTVIDKPTSDMTPPPASDTIPRDAAENRDDPSAPTVNGHEAVHVVDLEEGKENDLTVLTANEDSQIVSKSVSKFRKLFAKDRSHSGERRRQQQEEPYLDGQPDPKDVGVLTHEESTNGHVIDYVPVEGDVGVGVVILEKPTKQGAAPGDDVDDPTTRKFKAGGARSWFHRTKPTPADLRNMKQDESGQAADAASNGQMRQDSMTVGVNTLDRDENGINTNVKLDFEDVFGEPDGTHSAACVWRASHVIFTRARAFIYKLLTLIFGIPCALVWALVFALLSCCHVWACMPGGRALAIAFNWPAKMWAYLVAAICDPLCRSCSLCFAAFRKRDDQQGLLHMA